MRDTRKAGAVAAATGQEDGARANSPSFHSTTIYLRGKPVMKVTAGVAYRKAGRGERLRKPEAWSFHEEVLQQLEAAGVRQIVVEDLESGHIYAVDWSTFLAKSFPLDRGAGPQRALPIQYWRAVHGNPAAVTRWQQPSLFDL